jgi:hypothetical protein
MATELEPIVGNWYRHVDKGQTFTVVAVDERNDVVEIQDFDGGLAEIELTAWPDLELEAAEAPEDWTGPVDDVETDDMDYSETDMESADWQRPLEGQPAGGNDVSEETPEDEAEWEESAEPSDRDESDRDRGEWDEED